MYDFLPPSLILVWEWVHLEQRLLFHDKSLNWSSLSFTFFQNVLFGMILRSISGKKIFIFVPNSMDVTPKKVILEIHIYFNLYHTIDICAIQTLIHDLPNNLLFLRVTHYFIQTKQHASKYNFISGRPKPLCMASCNYLYLILGCFPCQINLSISLCHCLNGTLVINIGIVWNINNIFGKIFILIIEILPNKDNCIFIPSK